MKYFLFFTTFFYLFIMRILSQDNLKCYDSSSTNLVDCPNGTENCFIKIGIKESECKIPNCFKCKEGRWNSKTVCKECSSESNEDSSTSTSADNKYNIFCESAECMLKINDNKNFEKQYFKDAVDCILSNYLKCTGNFCKPQLQCYQYNSGTVEQGCMKKEDHCELPHCYMCNGNKCNSKLICKSCGKNESDCSNIDANDTKYNVICDTSLKCLVKLDDKRVVRSCAPINTTNCVQPNCMLCYENFCNAGIFPEHRLQCHQCNGENCTDVAQTKAYLKQCLNYVEDDKCYTYGENENSMQRGCFSDEEKPAACLNLHNNSKCLLCNDIGCNKKLFKMEALKKCIKCEGDKTKQDCFEKQDVENAKKCTNSVLYYKEEFCYTELKDETIVRNCLNDRMSDQPDCNNVNTCVTCLQDGCNGNKETVNFTCIQCRSDLNVTCRNEATKFQGTKCRMGLGWTEGCFYGSWNNVIIRGCLIDADETMKYVCKDNNNHQCFSCQGRDCNTTPASLANKCLQFQSNVILSLIIAVLFSTFFSNKIWSIDA